MKISCTYCQMIHEKSYICEEKKKALKESRKRKQDKYNKNNNDYIKFLQSKAWKKKRLEIYRRDKGLCQCCIREMPGTLYTYTAGEEVHHILKGKNNISKRLDNGNLILLCKFHHEIAEAGEFKINELLMIVKEQEEKNESEE